MTTLKFDCKKLQRYTVLEDQSLNQSFVDNFFVGSSDEKVIYAIFIVTINKYPKVVYANVEENYNLGLITYNEYVNQVAESLLMTYNYDSLSVLFNQFIQLCKNDYNKMCSVIGTVELMIKISDNYYTTTRLKHALDKSEVEAIAQIDASEKVFKQCFNSLEKQLKLS